MADAEYLKNTVAEVLSDGLAATVAAQADDPVAYLGQYLLSHVKRVQAVEQYTAEQEELVKQRVAAADAASKKEAAAAPVRAAAKAAADAEAALLQRLQTAGVVDEALLGAVLAAAQADAGGATAAYLAKKEAYVAVEGEALDDLAVDEDEDEAAEPTLQLRYLAATPDHEWMLSRSMVEGQGVTFPCWVMPEVEEEEEEEELDEDEEPAPKPAPELPTVVIDSVLHDGPVKFLRIPKLGGYVALPLRYTSHIHPDVLPEVPEDVQEEEAEEEEGEEGEEEEGKEGKEEGPPEVVIPPGNTVEVDLALCVDSVGQNRPFTPEQVAALGKWGGALKEALQRTEAAAYEADWTALEAMRTANNALLEEWDTTAANISDDAEAARAEAGAEATEAAGEEEVKEEQMALLDATVPLTVAAKGLAVPGVVEQWDTTVARTIPPAGEALAVLRGVAYMLGATAEGLGDPNSRAPTLPHWPAMKAFFGKDALARIAATDATAAWPAEVAAVAAAAAEAAAEAAAAAAEGKEEEEGEEEEGKEEGDAPAASAAGEAAEAQAPAHTGPVPNVDAARECIEGLEREGLLKGTYNSGLVFALLLDWINAVFAVNEAAVTWRARQKADAEEAARAAAEEAARLAEEEAEAEREETED